MIVMLRQTSEACGGVAGCDVGLKKQTASEWWSQATGVRKRLSATRKIKQMKAEGPIKRLDIDPSRNYGRCVIWTGANADLFGEIANDLMQRLETKKGLRWFPRTG